MFNLNSEIETILNELNIEHGFLHYEGQSDTYVVYMQTYKDGALYADGELEGLVMHYDFDVYSKGNYTALIDSLIDALTENGWTYQPSRDSADMFETDTKFYHKTLGFEKEGGILNG